MVYILTGATGFLGQYLLKELIFNVGGGVFVILTKSPDKLPSNILKHVKIVKCNIENYDQNDISNILKSTTDCDDRIFYHLAWAGTSGPGRMDETLQLLNIKLSCKMLELSSRLGCKRFINAGSIMEYEAMKYITIDGITPRKGYIYSIAKLSSNFMLKTLASHLGIDYINLIISNIYGPGERSERFLNTILKKMLTNETINMTSGVQMYDFIYASDAAHAIALVGLKGQSFHSYYIGNTEQKPLKEFVLSMKKVLNSTSELLFGTIPYNGPYLTFKEFNTNKLQTLGFKPQISFEEGVLLTKLWLLKNIMN